MYNYSCICISFAFEQFSFLSLSRNHRDLFSSQKPARLQPQLLINVDTLINSNKTRDTCNHKLK